MLRKCTGMIARNSCRFTVPGYLSPEQMCSVIATAFRYAYYAVWYTSFTPDERVVDFYLSCY